ncbi:hypothetical protein KC349_g7145 [Hortaea werneckii]|nr:hypothetical protein KC349_g7145 [Hortaea werneckii]
METSLSAFPEELIARVSGQVPLDSLVQFALACRVTYRCAKPRLIANQQYDEQEQKVQHDRLPLTVPSLLRKIFKEPDSSFHWHSLDIWGIRPGWQEWTTWDFLNYNGPVAGGDVDDPNWPEPAENHTHLDSSFFEPTELQFYADCMRRKHWLDSDQTKRWMAQVQDGWDEPLKALLVALSPRLRRLNFVAEYMEDPVQHPLSLLTEAISRIYHTPKAVWPPGFMALRRVSVNTFSNIRHPSDGFYVAPAEVAPLFLLPNIKVLNLSVLREDEPNPDFHLPPSSSSVEELTFYSCELRSEAHEKLLLAPRELKRLRCVHGSGFTKRLTGKLAERYANTLEVLLVDGHHKIDNACLKKFAKLAFLSGVELSNLSMCTTHSRPFPESAHGCVSADLRTILPFSLQHLGIQDCSPNWESGVLQYGRRNAGKDSLNAIADLAEDNRFEHLREICFWGINLGNECDEALMRIRTTGVSLCQDWQDDGKLREDDYLERRRAAFGDHGKVETDPFV